MNKQMKTYYIEPQTIADIEATAKAYGLSNSRALDHIIHQFKKNSKAMKKIREEEEANRMGHPEDK